MLRFILVSAIALMALLSTACGDSGAVAEEPECTAMLDPDPVCVAFCQRIVGDCAAGTFSEASCREGCQTNLECDGYRNSDVCGEAWEAGFQCVAELDDCQDVYDWRDKEPRDAFPCRPEVLDREAACPD